MRSIWSKIGKLSARAISGKKRASRQIRLGVELLENRLTPATMVSLDASSNLTIADIIGASTNDNIKIRSDTTNEQFIISDPTNAINTDVAGATGGGTNTISVPFSAVTGDAIFVNLFAGDDALTIDMSLGDFAKTITYDAGTNGAGGDGLNLQGGGTFANVTHTFTSASAGSVAVTGNGLISYSGLEDSLGDNLSATDRAFLSNGGAETIFLIDLLGAPVMSIDSSLGLPVTFGNPTGSLTIDAGAGNDTVNITSVDGGFHASLVINGGTGDDTIDLAADINFGANQNLDINLQDDAATPGVDQIHVAVNANLQLAGTGTAILAASRSILMESGSSIITADGNLTLAANQQSTPTSGAFVGITVSGAAVQSTGSGQVQFLGKGGSTSTNNYGVRVTAGGVVQSGSGPLQVTGTGGASTGSGNAGVFVETVGSTIRSAGGNVQVVDQGGGSGASFGNTGVLVRSGQISAGGTGTVTVQGTGGTTSGGPNRGIEVIGGAITSSGGAVQVTGTGAAVGATNGNNVGVFVGTGGVISAGGQGTVQVQGNGSTAGGVGNHGVWVSDSSSKITSGGGNIQITGAQGAGPGFAIAVTSSASVVSVGSANVNLIGDSIFIDTNASIVGGANTVQLRQRTNGVAIDLGGADASGVLGLTDAELDRVTAGAIDIGDTNAGSITISATISRGTTTVMNLTTGGNITFGSLGVLISYPAAATLSAPNGSIITPAGSSASAPDVAASTVTVDGIVSPGGISPAGAAPGEFAVTGSLAFSNTDKYQAQLNGGAPNTQYDRISVTGAANLGSAILDVTMGFSPAVGQPFVIVDTAAGVVGTFRDTLGNTLNEGASFNVNGVTLSITYAGGTDGKDVVLRALTSGVTMAISDCTLVEGNTGTTTFTFDVTLSAPGPQTITVKFATANGSATVADSDYVANSGTLQFAPGETSKQVSVTVNGDNNFEGNDVFVVNLSNAVNAAIGDGQGLGTIVNDDNRPTVSIDDVTANEGTFVTTDFTFTVSLSNPTSDTVHINWQTFDGSATAGDGDYFPDSGTLTLTPGETTKTITVGINADDKFERDDAFTVKIFVGSEVVLADDTGVGTILNDDATPKIHINDLSNFEGNADTRTLTFPVLLSNPSYLPITVDYASADGSATVADNDYQSVSGTLTFMPGQTAKVVTVLINGDTKFEPDESFTLNLSNLSNAEFEDATAVGGIQNDDGAPTISINDVSMTEGNSDTTSFVFTVSLSNASSQTVSVDFTTADQSALVDDGDYQGNSGTLTFAPGETSQTVTVLVNGDTTFEPNETFSVNLSGAANASIADDSGLGTIQNDDARPTITINDVSMPEGNTGTTSFVFTVSLSNASAATITVDFATANGSATLADTDYQSASGTLTIAPGQTSKSVTVLINGDTKFEPNEAFAVNLSNAVGASIADADGAATIENDDSQPTISINDVTISEGDSGTTAFVFTVSLSNQSSQTITVDFATANNTATLADNDYQSAAGTLTFAAGQTSKTITVLANGDAKYELDDTFAVGLGSATNATIADANGVGTIANDDPLPTISINDVNQSEGNSGTTARVFTVSLSNPSSQTITVAYATANGGATLADSDYQTTSGTLTFSPDQTTKTISVLVNGDTKFETNEGFFVNLSDPGQATIFDGQGKGTIVNDDAQPTISINDVTRTEGHSGTVGFAFTVSLSNASFQSITVAYATANGSATGSDYQATSGVLTFNPNQTVKTVTVLANGDRVGEPNETFFVNLSAPTNATIADAQGLGTIQDDEPRISIGDVTLQEGKNQKTLFTFTVTLSAAYDQAVTMSFQTVNGTATSGSDFVALNGTLTFNAGETTKTITIEVIGDNKKEADESFFVDLSSNSGNSLFTKNRGIGTILNDD